MFTGLIEAVAPLISNVARGSGRRLRVRLGPGWAGAEGARLGDSVSVNGACLTIARLEGTEAEFDVLAETARVSTLGELRAGEEVNLERALRADGRFGGHLVQGHVDEVGTVERAEAGAGEDTLWIAARREFLGSLVAKGSVAVDGVSLTVVRAEEGRFSVSLIPTTRTGTNLGRRRRGDKVNLEADVIGKYVRKGLEEIFGRARRAEGMTLEKLREMGFA